MSYKHFFNNPLFCLPGVPINVPGFLLDCIVIHSLSELLLTDFFDAEDIVVHLYDDRVNK